MLGGYDDGIIVSFATHNRRDMGLFKKIKEAGQVNLKKTLCPECGTEQPRVRKPKNLRQALWGGTTCTNCGCEMDRFGRKQEPKK